MSSSDRFDNSYSTTKDNSKVTSSLQNELHQSTIISNSDNDGIHTKTVDTIYNDNIINKRAGESNTAINNPLDDHPIKHQELTGNHKYWKVASGSNHQPH